MKSTGRSDDFTVKGAVIALYDRVPPGNAPPPPPAPAPSNQSLDYLVTISKQRLEQYCQRSVLTEFNMKIQQICKSAVHSVTQYDDAQQSVIQMDSIAEKVSLFVK